MQDTQTIQAGSPRLQAAAESVRSEAEARAARAGSRSRIQPIPRSEIGRMYLYEVAHKDGSYFVESDHLPRGRNMVEADALAGAYQEDDLVAVWELNPAEGSMRDISEDIALAMLDQSEATDEWALSDFIRETLGETTISDHFADRDAWADEARALASPYLSGRI